VNLEGVNEQDLTLQVISLEGKIIFEEDINVSASQFETQINLGSVAAGIYYVKVSGDDYSGIQKITIQ
jgi:hypothetical protein